MNEFDLILEECVDLIARGETSPEECLAAYPEYAAQLEPILYTAVCLQEGREVTPPPFLRSRIRAELNQAMKSKSTPGDDGRVPLFFRRKALNLAMLVFVFLTTNTVFAQGALPGEILYRWKLASENLWRSITADPVGTDLKLSDRRINEYVAVSSDEQRRTEVLLGYNKLLVRFKDDQTEADRARIMTVLKSQKNVLNKIGLSIPELDDYFSGINHSLSPVSSTP